LKNKCDIAMGGITATVKRQKLFTLSNHILPNKKVAVFSKKNSNIFSGFHSIDHDDVTVIDEKVM